MKTLIALSTLLALPALCGGGEVVGRLQPVGEVASAGLQLAGKAEVAIESARLVDIRGRDPADLEFACELRVTRHDGVTGKDSLRFVCNGRLILRDSDGNRMLELESPVQKGVSDVTRVAGEWMPVSFSLAGLSVGSGRIADVVAFDHNDIPKKSPEQTGITYEIRNARILDVRAERAWEAKLANATKAEENPHPLTTCNPLDIEYMIEPSRRRDNGTMTDVYIISGDPAIVVFKGEYWLFASHADGYWFSKDLAKWTFVRVPPDHPFIVQFRKWAPGMCVIDDTLYLTHSENGDVLKTVDPHDVKKWELVGHPSGWADPAFLYDDPAEGGDGYVYAYGGLSHRNPIGVQRLDPKNNFKVVGGPWELAWPDKENRGYEVPGDNNEAYGKNDTQEGPWVVKHGGRYYLTCAVPGTEYATYCDNCYVAPTPIGPFVFAPNSPVSRKSTGFTQGAGHGGLFKDLNGNWWKIDLCRVRGIDRRLVLLPAKFDADGRLYTNSYLSDMPFYVPGRSKAPFDDPSPGWMLLSYGKRATASSNAFGASLAFDEKSYDSWVPATNKPGEWLSVDLGRLCAVRSVQVSFDDVDYKTGGRDHDFAYRYVLEFSQNGRDWKMLVDRSRATQNRQHEYIEFKAAVGARYVRLTNRSEKIPGNGRFAVSALRIFGEGGGARPAAVDMKGVYAERRADNNRTVGVEWPKAEGAEGYIVRYGLSPDRMYQHHQVWNLQSCRINALNRGHDYYLTVDALNENGVTYGTEIICLKATEPLVEGYDPGENNTALRARTKGLPVLEAELAERAGEGLGVEYEVRASGVKALHGFGAKGSRVTFTLPNAGRVIRLAYAAIEPARLAVVVGSRRQEVTLPKTRGWSSFATVDIPAEGLSSGAKLTLEGLGDAVILDWMQVLAAADDK